MERNICNPDIEFLFIFQTHLSHLFSEAILVIKIALNTNWNICANTQIQLNDQFTKMFCKNDKNENCFFPLSIK